MKNFVFISPNFPTNYWKFCRELRNNGFDVLGVGDCPYENLAPELKDSLTEYYWVHSLKNYDEYTAPWRSLPSNTAGLTL